jgi:hypothetical protein
MTAGLTALSLFRDDAPSLPDAYTGEMAGVGLFQAPASAPDHTSAAR